jgi:type I restriction enzyme S subunit
MKPKLRFPGFTDDWEQRKLGEIGQCQSGVGFPDAEQGGTTGIPFFKVSDMNNPGNETEMVNANNYVTEEQIARKKWKPITEVPAMFFAKVGAAVLLNRKRLVSFPFLLDNNTMAYKFSSKWDARFGKAVFETIYLPGLAQTGALPSYNARDVENISIFIPATKEEQVRIGGFFKTIDDTITLHQRKCDSLVKLKKALLQKMFPKNGESVPEVRFPGFTEPWEQRKLGDIGNTFTGLTGKTKVDFGHGEAKFITYLNIFNNAIADPEQLESVEIDPKQNEVKYGDIFFTTSSETPEEVGMSSIWLQNQANVYLNSFCFGYRPQIAIDPYFMAFNLRSESVRKKFIFLAQGISRYNISKNKVMEMEINLPCLSEQKKIGEFFFKLDNLITLHQRKVQALQKLKKALLQQMFV